MAERGRPLFALHDDASPWLDALLALDGLTLAAHTEAAGVPWDAEDHQRTVRESLRTARFLGVSRAGRLVAYALLRTPRHGREGIWFVAMLNTAPAARSPALLRQLLGGIGALLTRENAVKIESHVYKTNPASLALHRRLGFVVTQENDRAVAFSAEVDTLMNPPWLQRSEPKRPLASEAC